MDQEVDLSSGDGIVQLAATAGKTMIVSRRLSWAERSENGDEEEAEPKFPTPVTKNPL